MTREQMIDEAVRAAFPGLVGRHVMRKIREGDRSLTQADFFRVWNYYRNIRRRETMMNRIERMVS